MALQIGAVAPDFEAETTEGKIKFHDWIGNSWALFVLPSEGLHPGLHHRTRRAGPPEAGIRPARRQADGPVGRSGRPPRQMVRGHQGDPGRCPELSDDRRHRLQRVQALRACCRPRPPAISSPAPPADNQTVRNVFVIGPDKKIKLVMVYPMTTGRNFQEILRSIDSLQLTAKHRVATPADWKQGEDVIIAGSVTNDEAKTIYPQGWKEPKPYIRIVPQPK